MLGGATLPPSMGFKSVGLLGKLGLTKGGGSLMPTALGGITGASLLSYFMAKGASEEEAKELAQDVQRGEGIGFDQIRADLNKYKSGELSQSEMFGKNYRFLTPRNFVAAEGGRVGLKEGGRLINVDKMPRRKLVRHLNDMELPETNAGDFDDDHIRQILIDFAPDIFTGSWGSNSYAQGGRVGLKEGSPEFIGIDKAVKERPPESILMEIAKVLFRLTPPGAAMFAGKEATEMYQNLNDEDKEKVQEFGKRALRGIGLPGMAASAGMSLYNKFKDKKAQGGRVGLRSGGMNKRRDAFDAAFDAAIDEYMSINDVDAVPIDIQEGIFNSLRKKMLGRAEGGRVGLKEGTKDGTVGIESLRLGEYDMEGFQNKGKGNTLMFGSDDLKRISQSLESGKLSNLSPRQKEKIKETILLARAGILNPTELMNEIGTLQLTPDAEKFLKTVTPDKTIEKVFLDKEGDFRKGFQKSF